MVHRSPNCFRNLVVASSLATVVLAALSLGGARAPWTTFDCGVVTSAGPPQESSIFVAEIGILRARRCSDTGCTTVDTPGTDSCDDIGK